MALNPGSIGNIVPANGFDWLARKIRELEVQIQQLQTAQPNVMASRNFDGTLNPAALGTQGWGLSAAGAAVINDGLLVGGNTTISGALDVTGNETVSGTLDVTGNMIVGGTLSLPNGIINNAALNAPVYPQTAHAEASNFALTTTATEKVRATVSVPAGYSQALVFAAISANARNKNTVQDYLEGYVDIFGTNSGWDSASDGAAGATIGISNSGSSLLTSLGSSFWIRGMLYSGATSWSADSFNTINVDAIVLFLR